MIVSSAISGAKQDSMLDIHPIDVCKECNHIIASHEYTFSVDDGFQVLCCVKIRYGNVIKHLMAKSLLRIAH